MINGQSDQVIRKGGENQEKKKQSAGFIIKEQAYQEEVGIPQCAFFIQYGIENKGNQQEYPEIQPGKEQGSILPIKEYV
jgi:hypothetical protein